jgi:hypothetical protein
MIGLKMYNIGHMTVDKDEQIIYLLNHIAHVWNSIVKFVWQNNSENDNDVKMYQVMHKSVC